MHGPLHLVNALDLWRDNIGSGGSEFPGSVRYRATSPIYAMELYRAVLELPDTGDSDVKFWTEDGKMALQATITS